MRSTLRLDTLVVRTPAEPAWRAWIVREWCFVRIVFRRLRWQIATLAIILMAGGILFRTLGDEPLSYVQAMYYTWSLVFGEPPQSFPTNPVLEAMFFVVPVLGLTVVLEG